MFRGTPRSKVRNCVSGHQYDLIFKLHIKNPMFNPPYCEARNSDLVLLRSFKTKSKKLKKLKINLKIGRRIFRKVKIICIIQNCLIK